MKEISVYRLSVRPRCQRLVHESAEETALDVERARARDSLLPDIVVDIDAPMFGSAPRSRTLRQSRLSVSGVSPLCRAGTQSIDA